MSWKYCSGILDTVELFVGRRLLVARLTQALACVELRPAVAKVWRFTREVGKLFGPPNGTMQQPLLSCISYTMPGNSCGWLVLAAAARRSIP